MKRFHIDCELGYDVIEQSLFVFNLAIPTTPAQCVVAEMISTLPGAVTDEFRDASGHNLSAIADLVRLGTGRDALDVPFATFFGSTRFRRLSPLVQPASDTGTLMALQTADAGVLLSPGELRSGYGS